LGIQKSQTVAKQFWRGENVRPYPMSKKPVHMKTPRINARTIARTIARMIGCILIANRGEIACRIIRTARSLGITTVAVYSDADAASPHVAMADRAFSLGAAPAKDSYLNIDKIIDAAKQTNADAIHPGYGFLSENEDFARAVEAAGLIFIGPPAEAIALMGNKAEAKIKMIAAGIPCVPGYEGNQQDDDALVAAADAIGYPVMIKAAAGGGGRGMRLVTRSSDMVSNLALARSEAENAFGSGQLILEKAIHRPRHVEVQIFADPYGNCIHLGERDCSVQRRHQKIIEEAPAPSMTPQLRGEMGAAAIAAARTVDYVGAGTVEFLIDEAGKFYFLEMNTRLQVEHPVTEEITGLDLVAMQISAARDEPLLLSQGDMTMTGHAMEARLYAEDPSNDFMPVTGKIDLWQCASGEGIRVDSGITTGQEISPYYDPLLAKIIGTGPTREIARARLVKALESSVLFGPVTNAPFLVAALKNKEFIEGKATTAFLSETYPNGYRSEQPAREDIAIAAVLSLQSEQKRAFASSTCVSRDHLGWSNAAPIPIPIQFTLNEETFDLTVMCTTSGWLVAETDKNADTKISISIQEIAANSAHLIVDGIKQQVTFLVGDLGDVSLASGSRRFLFQRFRPGSSGDSSADSNRITAPMPGTIVDIRISIDDAVSAGQTLVVLEAMKMQHEITAFSNSTIKTVLVKLGEQVSSGDLLIELMENS